MPEESTYTIKIDGAWSLEDFYELPHIFEQVYAFQCAFVTREAGDADRLAYAFKPYPWRGGYSTVNFYNGIKGRLPQDIRPKVKSIQYSSPGWIALTSVLVLAATQVGKVVRVFVESATSLNHLYNDIYKGLQDRKLLRIEGEHKQLELARSELDFAEESAQRLSTALGFESLSALNARTGNPLESLKILMSYYRRVRGLADYAKHGKAVFPLDVEPPVPQITDSRGVPLLPKATEDE